MDGGRTQLRDRMLRDAIVEVLRGPFDPAGEWGGTMTRRERVSAACLLVLSLLVPVRDSFRLLSGSRTKSD